MARRTNLVLASPQPLEQLLERARTYTIDSRSSATRRAYLSDFNGFETWCATQGLPSAPTTPAAVAVYLAALADGGRKASTIERALAGIAWAQRSRGCGWQKAHPAIAAVMTGIRRKHGIAPAQKTPVVDRELALLVGTLDEDLRGLRDRALLTMGGVGAFRRSELVALTGRRREKGARGPGRRRPPLEGRPGGPRRREGNPYASSPALCAVRAPAAWLEASGVTEGSIFRAIDRHGRIAGEGLSDRTVARIVQSAAERAGLDPKAFAGHSLRSGFATTAAKKGKSLDAIMRQTLHKSEQVARGYIRHAKLFDDNAAVGLV